MSSRPRLLSTITVTKARPQNESANKKSFLTLMCRSVSCVLLFYYDQDHDTSETTNERSYAVAMTWVAQGEWYRKVGAHLINQIITKVWFNPPTGHQIAEQHQPNAHHRISNGQIFPPETTLLPQCDSWYRESFRCHQFHTTLKRVHWRFTSS